MSMPTIMEQLAAIAEAAGSDLTVNDYACAASAMLFVVDQGYAAFNAWNESSTNKTIPFNQMLIALARIDHVFQGLDRAD